MPADRPPPDQAPPLIVPAAMMPVLQTISRIIYDHHFASVDDLAQFLHALVTPPTTYAPYPRSNLDRAQDLIYQAWEAAPDTDRMVALARQALAICPRLR